MSEPTEVKDEVKETEKVKTPTKKELAKEKAQAKLDARISEGSMVLCDDEVERKVVYRETAIDEGSNRYFLGERCRNGHMAERKVKGYVCTVCARLRQKARHQARMADDPEYKAKFAKKRADKHKARYADDPDYKQRVLDKAKARRDKKSAEKASMKDKAEAEIKDSAE